MVDSEVKLKLFLLLKVLLVVVELFLGWFGGGLLLKMGLKLLRLDWEMLVKLLLVEFFLVFLRFLKLLLRLLNVFLGVGVVVVFGWLFVVVVVGWVVRVELKMLFIFELESLVRLVDEVVVVVVGFLL